MGKKSKDKNKKRKKYGGDRERSLVYADDYQFYAIITKMLGDGRVMLKYINSKNRLTQSMGIIRGKMKRRVWINEGNLVLISERGFEDKKVDIIYKYNDKEMHILKNDGSVSKLLVGNYEDKNKDKDDEDLGDTYNFILDDEENETRDEPKIEESSLVDMINIDKINEIAVDEFDFDEI
tara:strand:+ start:354 stop:890 length:537 start_codon:yes stop_codon:yes gene_type:complete